jgi:nucleotide-binding universal stress UspA family protein
MGIMFRRILLPVDLSDRHQPVIDAAADLAGASGGEVILLHVIEIIAGSTIQEDQPFYNRLERAARDHLVKLGGALKQRQVKFRAEILYGNRGLEIIRYANDNECDLMVLMSPRVDPKNPGPGWGSLSYKISVFSPCPVLLVR